MIRTRRKQKVLRSWMQRPIRPLSIQPKLIFLCASAMNSTWVLLNSATDVWPGGLGSSSGELGHNLMDHHFRVGASGTVEGYEDKYYFGRRPTGFIFRVSATCLVRKGDYLRGFGYQGAASREGWNRNVAELGIGADLKEALTEPGNWTHRYDRLWRNASLPR